MQHTDIDNISNKLDEICDLETDVQIVEGFTDLKLSYIPVIKSNGLTAEWCYTNYP